MPHPPTVCKRINSTADFHTKSWSYRHDCPACGKQQRRNANFLGTRYELVCDGVTMHRQRRDKEAAV